MKTATFVIHSNLSLSEKEIIEELLLAETRMNDGSKVKFHLQECPSKIEELENKIEAYKFICKSANIPKFMIDHPESVRPDPLTTEDKRWAKNTIGSYKE